MNLNELDPAHSTLWRCFNSGRQNSWENRAFDPAIKGALYTFYTFHGFAIKIVRFKFASPSVPYPYGFHLAFGALLALSEPIQNLTQSRQGAKFNFFFATSRLCVSQVSKAASSARFATI